MWALIVTTPGGPAVSLHLAKVTASYTVQEDTCILLGRQGTCMERQHVAGLATQRLQRDGPDGWKTRTRSGAQLSWAGTEAKAKGGAVSR